MCSFDEQPLLKDNPYKKVKKLGVMSILDKKGFGLNHIFL